MIHHWGFPYLKQQWRLSDFLGIRWGYVVVGGAIYRHQFLSDSALSADHTATLRNGNPLKKPLNIRMST